MQPFQPGDAADAARQILAVSAHASPHEIEAAYVKRIGELRLAFLDLGGFPRDPLQQSLRFENFVVGPSNQEAFGVAQQVAAAPTTSCNPLYVFGNCGLGKTHLLNAIANEASHRRRRLVLLCSAPAFMEDMIQISARGRVQDFREKYRHLDYLLMDDVQMLGGKSRTTLDETYYLFNQLIGSGAQVVLAGRLSTGDMDEMGSGLRSRIHQAVAIEIRYPELQERQDIVALKAREMRVDLPRPLVYYLARHFTTDVRDLESAVKHIHAHVHQGGSVRTVSDIEELLFGGVSRKTPSKATMEDVQEMVSRHFHLEVRDLRQSTGSLKVKRARQIAIYLSKEMCGAAMDDLRAAFEAESSQIMYAQRKIKSNLGDPVLSEDLRCITRDLKADQSR